MRSRSLHKTDITSALECVLDTLLVLKKISNLKSCWTAADASTFIQLAYTATALTAYSRSSSST